MPKRNQVINLDKFSRTISNFKFYFKAFFIPGGAIGFLK